MNVEKAYELLKEIIEFRDIRKLVSSKHPEWFTPTSWAAYADTSELYILDRAATQMECNILTSLQDIFSNDEMEQKHTNLLSGWARAKKDYLALVDAKTPSFSEAVDIPNKCITHEKDNCNHV